VDQIDPNAVILHPDLVTGLNNRIYAITDEGLVEITEDGARTISTDAIGAQLRLATSKMRNGVPYSFGPWMVGDAHFNECWISLTQETYTATPGGYVPSVFLNSWVYNEDTQSFTSMTTRYDGACFEEEKQRLVYIRAVPVPASSATANSLITKEDFFPKAQGLYNYEPSKVRFNPLVSEDQGNLKHWMDVNFFMSPDRSTLVEHDDIVVNAEWGGSRLVDPDHLAEFGSVHFWVPRRFALKPSLESLGLLLNGGYYMLTGYSVRYRVVSDTLKRL